MNTCKRYFIEPYAFGIIGLRFYVFIWGFMVMQALLTVYGVMLLVGGWIGYRKAGSQKSLISGVISAVVIFLAVGLSFWQMDWGLGVGLVTAVLLAGVFVGRWRATGKVMPAGVMVGLSGAVAVMVGMTLFGG